MLRARTISCAAWVVTLVILVGAAPDQAGAHGFRPLPRMLYQEPSDERVQVLVSSDQGLHLTLDGGGSWYWVCEDIIGYDVFSFAMAGPESEDPRTRTWIAGGIGQTQEGEAQDIDGVYLSRDGGCNWSPAGGALAGQWTSVIRVHPERPEEILVATQHASMGNGVAISEDSGESWSWTALTDIEGELFSRRRWVNGMVRAASAPDVVYASSTNALHTSTDGGRTWTTWGEGLIENDTDILEVHLVDPDDAEVVYFSLYHPSGRRLYVSRDAGESAAPLLEDNTRDSAYMAIVTDDDGGRLLVLATDLGAIFRSGDEGESWTTEETFVPVECLVGDLTDPAVVFVCRNLYAQPPGTAPFALGRSGDGLAEVERWFTYADIEGHIACDEDSQVNQICVPLDMEGGGGDDVGIDSGGVDSGDAAGDAGVDASDAAVGVDVSSSGGDGGGCGGCSSNRASPQAWVEGVLLLLVVGLWRRL